MAAVTGLPKNFLGGSVFPRTSKNPFGIQSSNEVRFNGCNAIQTIYRSPLPGGRVQYLPAKNSRNRHVLNVGRGHYHTSNEEHLPQEPFWLTLLKEAVWGLKSLMVFLVEQPSQLKYIEWPSFQNTLKTATLTLILMALLIVALSSVDAVLCYLLAMFLRKIP